MTVYATALAPPLANDLESRLLLARVSIFVLPAGIVTVRHELDSQKPVFDIDEVVRRWDENADLLKMGAPALLHGLLDVIVDGSSTPSNNSTTRSKRSRTGCSTTGR